MPQDYTIVELPQFKKLLKKHLKKHPTIQKDIETAKTFLARAPDIMSDYIPGYDGKVGKFRMPISGSNIGKSGGARLIFFKDDSKKVIYLFFIYLKSDKTNIIDKDIDKILKEIQEFLF